jgi:hypothetical protein
LLSAALSAHSLCETVLPCGSYAKRSYATPAHCGFSAYIEKIREKEKTRESDVASTGSALQLQVALWNLNVSLVGLVKKRIIPSNPPSQISPSSSPNPSLSSPLIITARTNESALGKEK